MEQLFLQLALNWKFNLAISTICLGVYLTNYFVLKLKREYKGIHYQMFLILTLAPFFNLVFLIFNSILFLTRTTGYKVVKVKKNKAYVKTAKPVKA